MKNLVKSLQEQEEEDHIEINNKMSRRCCCCIPIVVGATILGLIGLIFSAGELGLLIPYMLDQYDVVDVSAFNPIKENLQNLYKVFQDTLEENKEELEMNQELIDEIMKNVKMLVPSVLMGATIESAVYALSCLLMLIACCTKVSSFKSFFLYSLYIHLNMSQKNANIFSGLRALLWVNLKSCNITL